MSAAGVRPISIAVTDAVRISGLLQTPPNARACYVLAHGAGAGMDYPFMVAVAAALAERSIATLRYQFPYMERRARRPDPPQLAQATVRAAVIAALGLAAEPSVDCRGQIVRRPYDVAGTDESSAGRRAWLGIPWISAPSGRTPLTGPWHASV